MGGRYLSIARVVTLSPTALHRYVSGLFNQEDPRRSDYFRAVLRALREDDTRSAELRRRIDALLAETDERLDFVRSALIEQLAREAGREENPPDFAEDSAAADADTDGVVLPIVVWTPHLRSPFNLGNIIRSAAAFGICGIVIGPDCPSLEHPRLRRAAMGGGRLVSIERGGEAEALGMLGGDASVLALETGGEAIDDFRFPDRGILMLGHEEHGLSKRELALAQGSAGVVSIPLEGVKRSLNVGVALGAALSWWNAALRRR